MRLLAIALLAASSATPGASAPPGGQGTGQPLSRSQFIAEMASEFRGIDTDRNGQLSAAEIERFQRERALAQAQERNRVMFAELDTDRNGQLSKSEFSKMSAPAPAPSAQPMLGRMDMNRDGQVSKAEHQAATLANFDRLDTNRDGNVTTEEMKAGGLAPR